MGGFGVFMAFVYAGRQLGADIKDCRTRLRRKHYAEENGIPFYVNKDGYPVHTDTGEPYDYKWRNGDMYEVNPYTNEVVRNVTQPKREAFINANKAEAMANGKKWYCVMDASKGMAQDIRGSRWKCVDKPDSTYVKRMVCGKTWYMDVDSLMFEDVARDDIKDGQKLMWYPLPEKGDFMFPISDELVGKERSYLNARQAKDHLDYNKMVVM